MLIQINENTWVNLNNICSLEIKDDFVYVSNGIEIIRYDMTKEYIEKLRKQMDCLFKPHNTLDNYKFQQEIENLNRKIERAEKSLEG